MRINLLIDKLGRVIFLWCITASLGYAQQYFDGPGQTIQINARFNTVSGFPSWSLVIRDIDHNQNIPYLFTIMPGNNHWVAFTFGKHYLIKSSRLQIVTYRSRCNTYKQYWLKNFCHLESNGRIIRGKSMTITIDGNLSPNTNAFSCHVSTYPDQYFYAAFNST